MIILARHGETTWNKENKMQGQKDSPLTEKGIKNANNIASFVEKQDIDKVYCSTLGRSEATASIISRQITCNVKRTKDIKEIDIGCFAGYSKKEVYRQHPYFAKVREENKWKVRWPNGESYLDVFKRIEDFTSANINKSLIIGHKSVNRAIIARILSMTPETVLTIDQKSDEIFLIDTSIQTLDKRVC